MMDHRVRLTIERRGYEVNVHLAVRHNMEDFALTQVVLAEYWQDPIIKITLEHMWLIVKEQLKL